MDKQETQAPSQEVERPEYPVFKYANHTTFFPSAYDLRLAFGDADPTTNMQVNKLHTGVTLSWPQAKLMLLYLRLNIEYHESAIGEIKIPRSALAPMIQEKISKEYTTIEEVLSAINQTLQENLDKQ